MKSTKEIDMKVNSMLGLINEAKFDGEEIQLLLERLGMDDQILRQLINSRDTDEVYNIINDKSENELNMGERSYITASVSPHLLSMVQLRHPKYLDEFGYQHFYDMVVDIVNELTSDVHNHYRLSKKHGVSMDWYFMNKAEGLFTAERVAKIAGGDRFLEVSKSVITTPHQ